MKENIDPELTSFSKRAQDIVANPRHVSAIEIKGSETNRWIWDFNLLKNNESDLLSDKILTLFYKCLSQSVLDLLFLETLSRMLLGKDIYFLNRLSFRELENFLRDENHLPVFVNSTNIAPEERFMAVKNSLLFSFLIKEILKNETFKPPIKAWEEMSLVERNRQIISLFQVINKLFSLEKSLQLALAETEVISIIMNQFPIAIEVLEGLIHELFKSTQKISSLKVVAVQ
ncbi:MAG: hypothetical protein Q7U04_03520 [Bacteriovorax sp.]|nr:hypothetical protein [Bacteriovorax sp.]